MTCSSWNRQPTVSCNMSCVWLLEKRNTSKSVKTAMYVSVLYTVSDTTIWLQASNELLRKYHIYANGRLRSPLPHWKLVHFKFANEAPSWTVLSQTKACTAKLSCTSCAEKEREKKHATVLLPWTHAYSESFVIPLKHQARQTMAISMTYLLNAIRHSYDTKLKPMVIHYAEKTNT